MVLVKVFSGWAGNSPKQNFSLLKERLEEIPGVRVEIVDYLGVSGPFTKLRTRSSIEELANNAESNLPYWGDEKVVAIGHSLGAIIMRLLIKRGHKFDECIFAGGPHRGFSAKLLFLYPLALLLRVRPFLEMMPGSDFLKSLGEAPPGIYIGSIKDEAVPLMSAIPKEANKKISLCCGHNMFPYKKEEESRSAIPVVVEIVRKYVNNSL